MDANLEKFFIACMTGDLNTAKTMLKTDPKLAHARGMVLPEHREYMRQNGADDGWTALHLAAHYGKLDVVQLLVENKADINARALNRIANTPLMAAIAGNDLAIVQFLLDKGANPKLTDASGLDALKLAEVDRKTQIADAIRSASKSS